MHAKLLFEKINRDLKIFLWKTYETEIFKKSSKLETVNPEHKAALTETLNKVHMDSLKSPLKKQIFNSISEFQYRIMGIQKQNNSYKITNNSSWIPKMGFLKFNNILTD